MKRTFKQMFSKHQGGKNGNSSKVQRGFVLFFARTPAIFINEFQQVFPLMVLVRAWLSCNVSLHCLFVGFHWCASECRRSLSIFTHRRQSLILRLSFHQVIALAVKEISVRFQDENMHFICLNITMFSPLGSITDFVIFTFRISITNECRNV